MVGTHGDPASRLALMTPEQLLPWTQQEQQLQNSSCSAGPSLIRAAAQNSLQDSAPDTPIAGLVLGDGMYAQLPQSGKQQTAEREATAATTCPAREPPCSSAPADAREKALHEARPTARSDGLGASSGCGGSSEDSDCAITHTDNSEEHEEDEESVMSASGESPRSTVQESYEDGKLPPQQQAEEQKHHDTCWLLVVADPNPTSSTGIDLDETPKLALGAASLLGTAPTTATACNIQTSKQCEKQLQRDTALGPAAVTAAAARMVSVSSSISAAASSMMSYTVQAIARLAARQQQQQPCQQCCTVRATNQHPQNKQFSAPRALPEEQPCQSACNADMNHYHHQQQQTVQVHGALQTKGHASFNNHPVQLSPQAARHQQLQQTVQPQQQQQQPFHQMFQHVHSRYKQVGGLQKQQLQHLGFSVTVHNPQQLQPLLQASSSYPAQGLQQQPSSQAVSATYGNKSTARRAAAASDYTVSSHLTTKRWQQVKQRRQQQPLPAPQHQQHDADVAAQVQPPTVCNQSQPAIAAAAAALRHAGETAAAAIAAAGRGPKQQLHDGAQQHLGSSTECKLSQSTSPSLTVVSSTAAVAATAKAAVGRSGPAAAVAVADRADTVSCSTLAPGCVLPAVPGHNGVQQKCSKVSSTASSTVSSTVSSTQPSYPSSTTLHLPQITEPPASSAVQQHGSRQGSPTRVDFNQLEGELAVVGISSCSSTRSSSPLGSRCGARDRLHNHDVSGASWQVASSISTAGGGTALDCTAGNTRGRPAAVTRLVLPKLPSIREKIQPTSSSRDTSPISATAKAIPSIQQQRSPQHVTQASPHGLSALTQLSNTARMAQQTALQEQHLATQPDKQGEVQQQGASSSSSSSLTAALGSSAADAVIAGSPWHSNRLSSRLSNGLMLQQAAAAAPLGYAALSPRVYEMHSNPPPPAAAATELTAAGAASHQQGQPASIRASSPKQQMLKKNSSKARGCSSSSAGRCSRPGSSNCQRTNASSPQSISVIKNSVDACSSDCHSGSGAAVIASSSRSRSGHSRPQSKGGSGRLSSSSGSGSGAPSRCASASQARENMICISIGSSSVQSNSRQTSLLIGRFSRPDSSCNPTRQALARDASGKETGCTKQDISSNSSVSHCKAAATTATAATAAASLPVLSVEATTGSELMLYATSDVSHASSSSTTSSSSSCGRLSDSAAAPLPASCTSSLEQPSFDAAPVTCTTEKFQIPSMGGEHAAVPAAAAVSGSSSSSSNSTEVGIDNGTSGIAREQQQEQQQRYVAVHQQQLVHQHQEQHAVNTPGLPFTLVTSVLGDSNAAAAGRSLLELQLQRLEDQSAQLAPVDLLETPKLPSGIAAAAAAVGGMVCAGGKVVTAQQAKAAAKHLQQQQQPGVQQQACNAGGQYRQQQHIQSQSLAQLASVKRCSKHGITALECALKPVAAVAAAPPPPTAAAPVEAVVEAGSMQQLRHPGSGNRVAAVPVCPGGAGVISGSVESEVPVAVVPALPAAFVCASAVAADTAKIVDAATRAGPAHMQDIWA